MFSPSGSRKRTTHKSSPKGASAAAGKKSSSPKGVRRTGKKSSSPVASAAASAAASRIPVPNSNAIGSGGYGTVFSPAFENTNFTDDTHNRREWVTKVFLRNGNYQKAAINIPTVQGLGFNYNAHRYKRPLRISRNVPAAKRADLLAAVGSDEIFGLRMPHKGESIDKITSDRAFRELRQLPVYAIMGQTCKMIRQVSTLLESGYIHGDIRTPNILVDRATGIFTIIDFDWFDPKHEFFSEYFTSFGFYSNPPETLLVDPSKRGNYISAFRQSFVDHACLRSLDATNHLNFAYLLRKSGRPVLDNRPMTWDKTLDTFDSFGLAWSLLSLFQFLYPGSLNNNVPALKSALATRISNNGVPYTDEELDTCAVAINAMVQAVLLPLGDFNLKDRQTISNVYTHAIAILSASRPAI